MFDRASWDVLIRECMRYIKALKDEIKIDYSLSNHKLEAHPQWSDSLHKKIL